MPIWCVYVMPPSPDTHGETDPDMLSGRTGLQFPELPKVHFSSLPSLSLQSLYKGRTFSVSVSEKIPFLQNVDPEELRPMIIFTISNMASFHIDLQGGPREVMFSSSFGINYDLIVIETR